MSALPSNQLVCDGPPVPVDGKADTTGASVELRSGAIGVAGAESFSTGVVDATSVSAGSG